MAKSNEWRKTMRRWDDFIADPPQVSRRGTAKLKMASSPGATKSAMTARAEQVFSPAFWEDMIQQYMVDVLLKEMRSEWEREMSDPMNLPQLVKESHEGGQAHNRTTTTSIDNLGSSGGRTTGGGTINTQGDERSMMKGFQQLWDILKTPHPTQAGHTSGVALGRMTDLLRPRLSDQFRSSASTSSKLNTLWYAVEYGTGMLTGHDDGADVAGDRWLRREGPTKDPRPEYRGSWWLGTEAGEGAHWKGQQGFHFLFDVRNRQPREKWFDFIERTLPEYVQQKLKELGGFGMTSFSGIGQ